MERDLEGQARVMRLNVLDSIGAQAARRLGVRAVPTFFVLDGQGKVVDTQVGMPDRARFKSDVDALMVR